jgi:hypothetical protein
MSPTFCRPPANATRKKTGKTIYGIASAGLKNA